MQPGSVRRPASQRLRPAAVGPRLGQHRTGRSLGAHASAAGSLAEHRVERGLRVRLGRADAARGLLGGRLRRHAAAGRDAAVRTRLQRAAVVQRPVEPVFGRLRPRPPDEAGAVRAPQGGRRRRALRGARAADGQPGVRGAAVRRPVVRQRVGRLRGRVQPPEQGGALPGRGGQGCAGLRRKREADGQESLLFLL